MTSVVYVIMCIVGYLFGCIQTAFLIGKIVGRMDIRQKVLAMLVLPM